MITTLNGDITGLDFDLIVNPANTQLLPGAGVCGEIFRKAGQPLADACDEIGSLEVGEAILTDSYGLPCKGIIHAAGPVWIDGRHNEEEDLAAAYWNSLSLAYSYLREHEMESLSLAFPSISEGMYGFPARKACAIAVNTVKKLMREYPDAKAVNVTFVLRSPQDYTLYKEELGKRT